ncbi:RNA polymerase sigma factor [Knoellia locipacati]|uniref:sigma factor-like helix-turn-helix DNA-binding protein n=1 Tax=Knoellia locipacati TaxID=882824 RepID=UPI00384F105F
MSPLLRAAGERGPGEPGSVAELDREQALAVLIRAHGTDLVRLGCALTGDRGAAEEAVERAFVALHRKWRTLRDRSAMRSHLRAAVVSGCRSIESGRVRRVRVSKALRPDGAVLHGADAEALAHEAAWRLTEQVWELPQRQREVIVCRLYLDLTELETADLLQVSVGSVEKQSDRALATLDGQQGGVAPNPVESRTGEALHHVVDGLSVTDDDLARMEEELFTSLVGPRERDGARRWRLRWGLVVAAVAASAVAGVLAVSGDDRVAVERRTRPPASDRPLVPVDLVGAWRAVPDSLGVWVFAADGGVGRDPGAADYLEGGDVSGRILSRSGDVYTVHSEDGCDETVRIRERRPGAVELWALATTCDPDLGPAPEAILLERVSPDPYLGGELATPPPSQEPGFLPQSSLVDGVWLHVESGTLLGIGQPWRTGVLRYTLDDDGDGKSDPDQQGRVVMSPTAPPVFRPDASTERPACVLAFASLSILHNTMTTTTGPAGGGCLPAGATQIWRRIA